MIDFTTLQANPIPAPISQLQKENLKLQGKNKMFEKIILFAFTLGILVLIFFIIKDAKNRKTDEN